MGNKATWNHPKSRYDGDGTLDMILFQPKVAPMGE